MSTQEMVQLSSYYLFFSKTLQTALQNDRMAGANMLESTANTAIAKHQESQNGHVSAWQSHVTLSLVLSRALIHLRCTHEIAMKPSDSNQKQ